MRYLNFIRSFFAVIAAILIFIIVLTICILFITKGLFTEEGLETIIKDVDILEQNTSVIVDPNDFHRQLDKTSTLSTTIDYIANKNKIPKDLIENIIEDEQVIKLVAQYFSNNIEYLFLDKKRTTITEEEIKQIVAIHIQEFNKDQDAKISSENETVIVDFIVTYTNNFDKLLPTIKEVNNGKLNLLFKTAKYALMTKTIITLFLILVALFALIGFLKKNWYLSLKYGGVAILSVGILLTLIGIASKLLNTLLGKGLGSSINVGTAIINYILTHILIFGIITLIISIAMLVSHSIIYKKKENLIIEEKIETKSNEAVIKKRKKKRKKKHKKKKK